MESSANIVCKRCFLFQIELKKSVTRTCCAKDSKSFVQQVELHPSRRDVGRPDDNTP